MPENITNQVRVKSSRNSINVQPTCSQNEEQKDSQSSHLQEYETASLLDRSNVVESELTYVPNSENTNQNSELESTHTLQANSIKSMDSEYTENFTRSDAIFKKQDHSRTSSTKASKQPDLRERISSKQAAMSKMTEPFERQSSIQQNSESRSELSSRQKSILESSETREKSLISSTEISRDKMNSRHSSHHSCLKERSAKEPSVYELLGLIEKTSRQPSLHEPVELKEKKISRQSSVHEPINFTERSSRQQSVHEPISLTERSSRQQSVHEPISFTERSSRQQSVHEPFSLTERSSRQQSVHEPISFTERSSRQQSVHEPFSLTERSSRQQSVHEPISFTERSSRQPSVHEPINFTERSSRQQSVHEPISFTERSSRQQSVQEPVELNERLNSRHSSRHEIIELRELLSGRQQTLQEPFDLKEPIDLEKHCEIPYSRNLVEDSINESLFQNNGSAFVNNHLSSSLEFTTLFNTDKPSRSLITGNSVYNSAIHQPQQGSTFLSKIEEAILRSANPIEIDESEEIEILGQKGIWANKEEVQNWRGPVPISQYCLNEDDYPEIITKKSNQNLEYVQELAIRYLKPPTPPLPGEIIITQEKNTCAAPAPPLIIRQQPPRPDTPEPLVIREAPPEAPCQVGRKVITSNLLSIFYIQFE